MNAGAAVRTMLLVGSAMLAHAATLEPGHRAGLIEGCVNAYQSMPAPPAAIAQSIPALKYRNDAGKLRKFCSCHADASYAAVPQADYNAWRRELRSGVPNGPAMRRVEAQSAARADAADRLCARIVG
jgi:hypothetical protein